MYVCVVAVWVFVVLLTAGTLPVMFHPSTLLWGRSRSPTHQKYVLIRSSFSRRSIPNPRIHWGRLMFTTVRILDLEWKPPSCPYAYGNLPPRRSQDIQPSTETIYVHLTHAPTMGYRSIFSTTFPLCVESTQEIERFQVSGVIQESLCRTRSQW